MVLCHNVCTDCFYETNQIFLSLLLQLKEFQSRQKPDLPQNAFIESSSEETPQNSLTNSFTSSTYQDQEVIPQQNYVPVGANTNQSDFSAFFNNPVVSDTQQNVFQTFGNQAVQHQFMNNFYTYRPNEVNELSSISQMESAVQLIDNSYSELSNNGTVTEPTFDTSKQLADELQAITLKLNAELVRNNELVGQLSKQNGLIEELQLELHKTKLENSVRSNVVDANSLKGQLEAHAQTISILVGEKTELTAALTKYQSLAHSNASEVEELQGRLNASRHRVSVLERDIGNMKSSHEKYDTTQQRLCDELEQCQEEIKKFKKLISDAEEEIAELKRSSSLKSEKIGALEQELKKKSSELELSKLRVEQLSVGDFVQSEGGLENLSAEKIFFEQKTQELERVIQQMNAERDQSSQQYQNYVQQLNQEISKMAQQLQEYVAENERLSKREQGLVKHVGDLERQIQQQLSNQKKNNEVSGTSEESSSLKSRCDALEVEKAQWQVNFELIFFRLVSKLCDCGCNLKQKYFQIQQQSHSEEIASIQRQLQEKDTLMAELESTLERIQSERPDSKNLIASIESDKIAASRAMSQNQNLKQQLEEMQKAFVQVVNVFCFTFQLLVKLPLSTISE